MMNFIQQEHLYVSIVEMQSYKTENNLNSIEF